MMNNKPDRDLSLTMTFGLRAATLAGLFVVTSMPDIAPSDANVQVIALAQENDGPHPSTCCVRP
jgi:hypothetical protein